MYKRETHFSVVVSQIANDLLGLSVARNPEELLGAVVDDAERSAELVASVERQVEVAYAVAQLLVGDALTLPLLLVDVDAVEGLVSSQLARILERRALMMRLLELDEHQVDSAGRSNRPIIEHVLARQADSSQHLLDALAASRLVSRRSDA